jgi:Putative restriction endonuclease
MSTVTLTERSRPNATVEPTLTPRLESGDRLTADEYMRRYENMPGVRAELIEGVVYVSSPVSIPHGKGHIDLSAWACIYRVYTPGVGALADSTVFLDPDNRPQPDIDLRILPSHGGRTSVTDDGKYLVGAPEMTIEIAASTATYDLHTKKDAYRRNEVWEYVVWRVFDREIDWFILRDGRYALLKPDAQGLLKSERFPGLWLDPAAALNDDMATVLRVLNEGLASPEHAAFVAHLGAEAARMAAQPQEPRP